MEIDNINPISITTSLSSVDTSTSSTAQSQPEDLESVQDEIIGNNIDILG